MKRLVMIIMVMLPSHFDEGVTWGMEGLLDAADRQ
jgi:hypothetical protein